MTDVQEKKSRTGLVAVIAVLVVLAVAALAAMSQMKDDADAAQEDSVDVVEEVVEAADEEAVPEVKIQPGNPVVAVVNGEEIKRSDVFAFIAGLPQNVRQMPVSQLFDLSIQQIINARLVENKASQARLDNDKDVKEQLDKAKEQIVRNVFMQREVEKQLTDEKVQGLYEAYKASFENIEETKASHILVESESEAKDIIKEAKKDASDFAELARENSSGPSAERGGDLGWFAKGEMVPEFSDAAFAAEPGTIVDEPVKTQFGWHVIKVEGRRNRPVPTLEEVRPMLENQLRRQILDTTVEGWREEADVKVYGINGEETEEPASEAPESGAEEAAE